MVQCKRNDPSRLVGSPEMQQLIGMGRIDHQAQTIIYATTSDYTAPARDLAADHDIVLLTGWDLVRLAAMPAAHA